MECNHWLVFAEQRSTGGRVLLAAAFGILMVLVTTTGCSMVGEQRQPVIVNLKVATSVANADPTSEEIAATQAIVLGKLKRIMQEDSYNSIRTYKFLPASALSADAQTVMYLLDMPEVYSVERDRDLQ